MPAVDNLNHTPNIHEAHQARASTIPSLFTNPIANCQLHPGAEEPQGVDRGGSVVGKHSLRGRCEGTCGER